MRLYCGCRGSLRSGTRGCRSLCRRLFWSFRSGGRVRCSWDERFDLDLTAQDLAGDVALEKFSGSVADSGEGRWTIEAAIEEAVPVNVLSAALYARFRSRQQATYADKLLSAMRFGFGGHVEIPQ